MPNSSIVYELVGAHAPAAFFADDDGGGSGARGGVARAAAPRFSRSLAALRDLGPVGSPQPLWISRATSDAERDARWYETFFGANVTYRADIVEEASAGDDDGGARPSNATTR